MLLAGAMLLAGGSSRAMLAIARLSCLVIMLLGLACALGPIGDSALDKIRPEEKIKVKRYLA